MMSKGITAVTKSLHEKSSIFLAQNKSKIITNISDNEYVYLSSVTVVVVVTIKDSCFSLA